MRHESICTSSYESSENFRLGTRACLVFAEAVGRMSDDVCMCNVALSPLVTARSIALHTHLERKHTEPYSVSCLFTLDFTNYPVVNILFSKIEMHICIHSLFRKWRNTDI